MQKPSYLPTERMVRCCNNRHPLPAGHQENWHGKTTPCRVCGSYRREWFMLRVSWRERLLYRFRMWQWRKYVSARPAL